MPQPSKNLWERIKQQLKDSTTLYHTATSPSAWLEGLRAGAKTSKAIDYTMGPAIGVASAAEDMVHGVGEMAKTLGRPILDPSNPQKRDEASNLLQNLVLFGVPAVADEARERTIQKYGGVPEFGDRQVAFHLEAMGEGALDYFGRQEFKKAAEAEGVASTMQHATHGVLQALPLLASLRALGATRRGADIANKIAEMRRAQVITSGDVAASEAMAARSLEGNIKRRQFKEGNPALGPSDIDPGPMGQRVETSAKKLGEAYNIGDADRLIKQMRSSEWWMLDNDVLRQILVDTAQTKLFKDIYGKLKKNNLEHEIYVRALLEDGGGLSTKRLTEYSQLFGLPLEDVNKALAVAVDVSAHMGAVTLEAFSKQSAINRVKWIGDAAKGDLSALAALKQVRDYGQAFMMPGAAPTTPTPNIFQRFGRIISEKGIPDFNDAMHFAKWYERNRRKVLVMKPQTAMRNFTTQLAARGQSIFDAFGMDLMEKLTGQKKLFPGSRAMELISKYGKTPGGTDPHLETFLKSLPDVKHRLQVRHLDDVVDYVSLDLLRRGSQGAAARTRLGEKIKGLPSTIMDDIENLTDRMNLLNNLQEYYFRSTAFHARMDANLKRLGLSDDIVEGRRTKTALQKATELFEADPATLDPTQLATREAFKLAVGESLDYAYRMSFTGSPVMGSFAAKILDLHKQIPILTALGPTAFPRFLWNQWNWVMRHNPMGLLDVLSPSVRKQIQEGMQAKKAIQSGSKELAVGKTRKTKDNTYTDTFDTAEQLLAGRNATELLGEALGGAALFSMAKAAQDLMGTSKPYMLANPADPSKLVDMRAYEPFSTALTLVGMGNRLAQGLDTGMTGQEIYSMFGGSRRTSESTLFAIADIVRDLDAKDPEVGVRSAFRALGEHIASWGMPAVVAQEAFALMQWASLGAAANTLEAASIIDPLVKKFTEGKSDTALIYKYALIDEWGPDGKPEDPIMQEILQEDTRFQQDGHKSFGEMADDVRRIRDQVGFGDSANAYDTQGNELTGPLATRVGWALKKFGMDVEMPGKVNLFTGEFIKYDQPNKMIGNLQQRPYTPFERFAMDAGIGGHEVVDYGNPIANNAVKRVMGLVLNTPLEKYADAEGNPRTMGDILMESIRGLGLDPQRDQHKVKELLMEELNALKTDAKNYIVEADPFMQWYFIEHEVKNSQEEDVRLFRPELLEAVRAKQNELKIPRRKDRDAHHYLPGAARPQQAP